jgi:hypothetical protein
MDLFHNALRGVSADKGAGLRQSYIPLNLISAPIKTFIAIWLRIPPIVLIESSYHEIKGMSIFAYFWTFWMRCSFNCFIK